MTDADTAVTTAATTGLISGVAEGDASYLNAMDQPTRATATATATALAAMQTANAVSGKKSLPKKRRGTIPLQTSAREGKRAAKESDGEERRARKSQPRVERERHLEQRKRAALDRCAELVSSNRVPIEITKATSSRRANARNGARNELSQQQKRSEIVVKTAADLNEIVNHANSLYKRYNNIAKQHGQRAGWLTVARELGIHVKVREKYSRMHARATARGFDWQTCGHFKVRDYPSIFQDPIRKDLTEVANPGDDAKVAKSAEAGEGDDGADVLGVTPIVQL